MVVAWMLDLNLRAPLASSILLRVNQSLSLIFSPPWTHSAVLILSVGVTARTLSTAPAVIPARIPRPGESTPNSSDREFLIVSYDTNLTAAFAAVP